MSSIPNGRELNTSSESTSTVVARAIGQIKAEHRALACVLAAMQAWVVQCREPGAGMDLDLFEAMLRYVENVPDRIHHPREDSVLFPAVAALEEGKPIVRELEREHALGPAMLNELRRTYEVLRTGGPNALNQLSTAVDEFAEFYLLHMRKEESRLLPLAAASLSPAQWERIDSAFSNNTDPLFGASITDKYRRLYQYITVRTPEPLKGYVEAAALR